MVRSLGAAALISLAALMPAGPAAAQDPLAGGIIGGAAGAIIGGAVTGRAGGAVAGGIIGGATGAMIGASQQRRGGFYWYEGRCYQAVPGGYQRVSRRYCY
ncbi:putative exported Uncharacterized protein [Rhodovulum sp. PH10]|uniref:glycine zipper domain-containing protein n=1 Tax=Rhodovulum sp. PH10 TaxID=1187851 RepID=UPI00027C27EA|nr:glycine zipper domain-containing protein [Rhodovulum sp. PH10]EJW11298.1 putative exported Uncharacterized protein [Rhodovulum sp. PH10]